MKKLEVVYKIINIKSLSNGYGLDDRVSGFRFPARAGNFSLLRRAQTGTGTHPASCPIGYGSSFTGDKAAGTGS